MKGGESGEVKQLQVDDAVPEQLVDNSTIQLAKGTIFTLVLINIGVWIAALVASVKYPALLSPALIAYSLGLRHAVDADHIAAIDNVTRSLLQKGKKSVTVGLFFSLGHSTVVVLMSVVVVCSVSFFNTHVDDGKTIGAIVGTSVSALFLCFIGLLNGFSFIRLYQKWRVARIEHLQHGTILSDINTVGGGVFGCCPKFFQVIDSPWKMYPLGFLFGLGFDTASEVGLLAISAITSQTGVPSSLVLLLPALFTCGMSLIDTLDGILMLWAYGWAYIHPAKKLFYNMFLTGLSSFVALFIGLFEALGIFSTQFHWEGWFADINMIVMVLSPAKTLNMSMPVYTKCTQPIHVEEASTLIDEMKKFTPAKLKTFLSVSDAIAKLNHQRYISFQKTNVPTEPSDSFKQAVLAFDGPAYKGLAIETWTEKDFDFAQDHLRILCGLYGMLLPLDLIQAYRLEMGQKLINPRGKDLYEFWGCTIANDINTAFESTSDKERILLNVASMEYFKSVDVSSLDESIRLIDCVFKDDGQIKSVYAKRARGLMVQHIITSQGTTLNDIKAFESEGYQFSAKESTDCTLVFHRSKAAATAVVAANKRKQTTGSTAVRKKQK